MLNTSFKQVAIAVLCAGLFGCNSESDEAKKLGFSNVDEMMEAHSKGWHTQQQYYKDNPQILAEKKAKIEKEKAKENKKKDIFDGAAELTASALFNEFEANKMVAEGKYRNIPTLISGVLNEIKEEKNRNENYIQLKFAHDTNRFAGVVVLIADSGEQRSRAMKLSKGDFVRVGCKGDIKDSVYLHVNGCALVDSPNVAETNGDNSPTKVDALSFALDQNTGGQKVNQYIGKLVETEIFVEKYLMKDGSKRLIDANSGLFCDIDPAQSSSFPDKRGGYVIKGILIIADGEVGLSRCQYVSSR